MSAAAMWRLIAAAFTVAVLIAGVLVAWSLLRPGASVQTATTDETFTRPITRLVFADFGGSDAIITAGPAGEVKVRRELRWSGEKRPESVEAWEGDTLTVTHNCGEVDSDVCSMRYHLTLPPEVKVEAEATAGDVVVRNMTGSIRVEVVSGDVRLDEDSGPVSVTTVSGDVSGSDLRSSNVELKGNSGDVDLGFAAAPQRVSVVKTSGDTRVLVPKGSGPYRVDAQTTSGDQKITVDAESGAERAIDVRSTSGDVTVAYA